MQVLLNTDANVDGRQAMADHLEKVVKDAMGRHADHVTRVEAHLTDANSSAKAGPDDIHCTLEARLAHREPLVVKDHAPTAHQAIHGAVNKLQRAVSTAVEKLQDVRHAPPVASVLADEDDAAAADDSRQA